MADQTTDETYFCPPDQATTEIIPGMNGQVPVCKSGGYWAVITHPESSGQSSTDFWNQKVNGKPLLEGFALVLACAFLWKMFRKAAP